MGFRTSIVCCFIVSTLTAAHAGAQGATFVGSVVRDSAGHAVPAAEVSLPGLGRGTTANYLGEFRLDGLPAGRHLIIIRRVGFDPLRDSVELVAGRMQQREFVLTPSATKLESVVVTAPQRQYISANLRAFEVRRASGFGRFISEVELRKSDGRPLGNLLLQLPGGTIGRGFYGKEFFLSSRQKCKGATLKTCNPPNCYVTLYLDGALIYSPADDNALPPDIGRLAPVSDLAGVEFYPSNSTIPSQFGSGDAGCGVLLLWSRER